MTQKEFNEQFITALEIAQLLGISRPAVTAAHQSGRLPKPILVNECRIMLWNRKEVMPYINDWKYVLDFRKPGN